MLTLVDLDTMTVVEVERPRRRAAARAGRATTPPRRSPTPDNIPSFPAGPRTDVRPLDIIQPEGPSFTVDGHHLRWQKWDLRIGFTAREGLVLHRIGYDDGGGCARSSTGRRCRRCSSPTATRGPTHYRKLVLDEGEYGIGLLTNSLELGCDCLGEIRYLDGVVNDNDGKAVTIPNAICLHEEDHGIAWKHTDFRTGYAEVRRMRRMVISCIVTVGNYEYGYYWYLYQDGTIEYEVKLTGVISTARCAGERQRPRTASSSPPASTARTTSTSSTSAWTWRSTAPPTGSTRSPRPRCPRARTTPSATPGAPRRSCIEDETMGRPRGRPAGRPLLEDRQRRTSRNELGQPVAYKLLPEHIDRRVRAPRLRGRPARAGFIAHHAVGHRLRPGRAVRHRRLPEPARRAAAACPPSPRGTATLTDTDVVRLVHLRHQPRGPSRGLAGHAGPPDRLPAVPSGFFVGNPALDNPQPGGDHCHRYSQKPKSTETA